VSESLKRFPQSCGGLGPDSGQCLRREEKYRGISNPFVDVRRRSFLFDMRDVVMSCSVLGREYSGGRIIASQYCAA